MLFTASCFYSYYNDDEKEKKDRNLSKNKCPRQSTVS